MDTVIQNFELFAQDIKQRRTRRAVGEMLLRTQQLSDFNIPIATGKLLNSKFRNITSTFIGMVGHGSNPKNWRTVVQSGEQAVLHVYYDPATHPDLRGPVTRIVTIYSDDPLAPKQELKIKVNQVG